MKKIFVVIGRFQPLHNGHSSMIKRAISIAAREVEKAEVLILVGSSNKERSIDNPFTYEERREVLLNHLEDETVHIRPLPDFDYQEDVWEENLHKTISQFAREHIEERYYIPVFVSARRGDDSELRDSWKSGGDTKFISPYTYKGGDLSATMVRDHLATVPVDKVFEDSTLNNMLPLHSRSFINENPEVHEHIVKERVAVENYKWIWKSAPFPPLFQTTDAFVIDKHDEVLLIERGGDIGSGQYAMAGGYLEHNLTLEENMKKELLEETNLNLDDYEHQILTPWVCDNPNRSHRGRIITTAFMIKLEHVSINELILSGVIKAGDDAAKVKRCPLRAIKIGSISLYSDHAGIINKLCEINNY